MQKYTQDQIDQIAKVHDDVAMACPNYESEVRNLLAVHEVDDVPEDAIPEAVADLIAETLAEPEPEESANGNGGDDEGVAGEAEEKLNGLKAALVNAKQKLMDLESDVEALVQQQMREIEAITDQWTGSRGDLRAHLKPVKEGHKIAIKALKDTQQERRKSLKAEIKALDKKMPQAERDLKLLSNRGKLELMLADEALIGTLTKRWIAAEVAKLRDYPIFMAVRRTRRQEQLWRL